MTTWWRGADPRSVLGRRPLLIVWAVTVGLLFRSDSPYRYAQEGYPYPWIRVAQLIAALTIEAVAVYLLLQRTPGRTKGLWLSIPTFAAFCVFNVTVFPRSFHSPGYDWTPAFFAMIGFVVFAVYAIGAEILFRVRRRRHVATS